MATTLVPFTDLNVGDVGYCTVQTTNRFPVEILVEVLRIAGDRIEVTPVAGNDTYFWITLDNIYRRWRLK